MNEKDYHNTDDDKTPGKILVVEDDESLRILIQRRLKRAGFITEGISNGADALARIAGNRFGLILVDYNLPDMSGEQFARALKDSNYNIPFIVATGQENETILAEMMRLGAREYLVKNDGFLQSLLVSVSAVLGS